MTSIGTRPDPVRRAYYNNCRPFPFSTDIWTSDTVAELNAYTRRQTTPREKAAGVVIGSGGLPYILARICVSRLVVDDLYESVVDRTIGRTLQIADYDNWYGYLTTARNGMNSTDVDLMEQEYNRAMKGGLLGMYSATRAGLSGLELAGVVGDIRDTVTEIADDLIDRDLLVTFVNLTNAADFSLNYTPPLGPQRNIECLGRAIGALPLAHDAVIVHSAYTHVPAVFSAADYPGISVS